MTENQFDEFFRKKLGDFSSKVPDDMWQRIKQKKDKDRTVFILLLLLLLVLGGATSYFIFNDGGGTDKNIAAVKKNADKNGNKIAVGQNKKHETVASQNDTANFNNKKNLGDDNNTALKNSFTLSKSIAPKKANKPESADGLMNSDKKNMKQYNSNLSNPSQSNTPVSGSDTLLENNLSERSIKPNEESITTKEDVKKSLLQIDSAKEVKKHTAVYKNEKSSRPIINNIFLEVFASPDIPVSRTSGTADYVRHKDSTSKMQLSYTVGVRAGTLLGQHFIVRTGLQYSEVNEEFNYTKKNATRTVPVVIERNLTDANGNTMTVLDTSTFMQVGSQYKLSYNHYKSFDVPVLIGYQTMGERFRASFNTGIILNVKTAYKGETIDSSLNAVDINANNFYKSNTGVSLYFGLGLSTKLNNNFQLFTEPYIRYRLSNMTGAQQPFTQKINVGGLSLGLRYNF